MAPFVRGLGCSRPVVDRLRDEAAHGGMHAPARRQEDAAIGRDGGRAVEQVVERRVARAAGVHALDGLAELHLVAEQHDVACAGARRHEVGQGDLARLVDEEVSNCSSAASSANSQAVPATSWALTPHTSSFEYDVLDVAVDREVQCRVDPLVAFLTARTSMARLAAPPSWRRPADVLIALWLLDMMPTRLPCARGGRSCASPCRSCRSPAGPARRGRFRSIARAAARLPASKSSPGATIGWPGATLSVEAARAGESP